MISKIKEKALKSEKRIAIFVSGSGTNMDNIIKKVNAGEIKNCEVALVFSDKARAMGLVKAKKQGVPVEHLDPAHFETKACYENEIAALLRKNKIDYIVLAGYMRILTPFFVNEFKNRILNIHPSLLPSFKGAHGIKDAYDYGVKVTGVTVHFVTDDLDGGPIIVQESIPVREKETLEDLEVRIHELEYQLYPKALNLVLSGKASIKKGKVVIKG